MRIYTLFTCLFQDLEIKEVKKSFMHHMKDVTTHQKQITAMVNFIGIF